MEGPDVPNVAEGSIMGFEAACSLSEEEHGLDIVPH